jgi:hypothetical protein
MDDIYFFEHKAKKYKYKYLKLKNELEGGKMEYGLYGFYSHYGDKLILRKKRFNEINYVHQLDLPRNANGDNIIIQHLRSNCTIDDTNNITEYYPGIKSFKFVPYGNISQDDHHNIQKLIDNTYFTDKLDFKDDKVNWTDINIIKKFRYRGYSDEISEKIVNSYVEKATELLADENNYKAVGDDKLTELRKDALLKVVDRTCDKIHEHPGDTSQVNGAPIILEELITDRQLILSSVLTGINYGKNPKIYHDPYTLVNEKLGALSWNLVINKATINCIMNNHKVLFPIRIVLDMHSDKLLFDNIMDTEKFKNYMGFFLIKYINNSDSVHYSLTINSNPHKSSQEYYIFFVFQNERPDFNIPLFTYTLTNFRNNIINWGTVIEKKSILYYEILQLMCMNLQNNIHFYLICNKNDYKESDDNLISWIYPDHLGHINFENNEIHILASKDNIDTVAEKLKKTDKLKLLNIDGENIKYIEYDDNYKLYQCHFGWYKIYDKGDKRDKFFIKLGEMDKFNKSIIKKNICVDIVQDVDQKDIYELDLLRYINLVAHNNIIEQHENHRFDLNESVIDLESSIPNIIRNLQTKNKLSYI